MKKMPLLQFLCLTLAALVVVPGYGQIAGSVSNVTLSLTGSFTMPGTVQKDENGKVVKGGPPVFINYWEIYKNGRLMEDVGEYVSKIQTAKYSNKEFLEDMVRLGVISSISGWSIKMVQANGAYSDEFGRSFPTVGNAKFYLGYKDSSYDPIPIGQYLWTETFADALAMTNRLSTKYNASERPISSTHTYSHTIKQFAIFHIDISEPAPGPSESFYLSGILAGGGKVALSKDKTRVIVPAVTKLGGISGNYVYEDEQNEEYYYDVVEGSITISAGVATADVSNYPNVKDEPE